MARQSVETFFLLVGCHAKTGCSDVRRAAPPGFSPEADMADMAPDSGIKTSPAEVREDMGPGRPAPQRAQTNEDEAN